MNPEESARLTLVADLRRTADDMMQEAVPVYSVRQARATRMRQAANEIEDLAKLHEFVLDVARYGLRADMTPTMVFTSDIAMYAHLTDYFKRAVDDLKARAKALVNYGA